MLYISYRQNVQIRGANTFVLIGYYRLRVRKAFVPNQPQHQTPQESELLHTLSILRTDYAMPKTSARTNSY